MSYKQKIGTLGDKNKVLTCSMSVLYKKFPESEKKSYASFEKGIIALKKEKIDMCIVPVAYPKIDSFIADQELRITDMFIEKIPNLVYVSKAAFLPLVVKTVYLHPATECLFNELLLKFSYLASTKKVFVASNSEACRLLLKDRNSAIAITNSLCANHYNLVERDILREGFPMPFIVFKKYKKSEVKVS